MKAWAASVFGLREIDRKRENIFKHSTFLLLKK